MQCVSAWVRGCRWWFPGCTVNPSARETLRLLLPVQPFRLGRSKCQSVSTSHLVELPTEGFPNCSSGSYFLLVYCPLPTAHCPLFTPTPRSCPLSPAAPNHPRALPVDDDDDDTGPAASVLWADGRAVHSTTSLLDLVQQAGSGLSH